MRPPRNTDQCITARTNAITWFTTRFRGNHCNFGIRSNVGATLYAAVGALFHMCMCLHKYYHGTRSCARSACMNVFMLGRSFAPSVCVTLTNVQVMRVRTEYTLHIVQKRVSKSVHVVRPLNCIVYFEYLMSKMCTLTQTT